MKAVVQRVKKAELSVCGKIVSQIGKGLVVFLGVKKGDEISDANYLACKIAHMRIFEDDAGKMNLSALDCNCQILSVSQFTLYGDTEKGNRPSFTAAEEPVKAEILYNYFCSLLTENGVSVKTGVFGEDMTIDQQNDGPVTIILESKNEIA